MPDAIAVAGPELECDLVMKGGITSGIVYPPALQALSQKYRFRQVGGTSAGAIAAACAAAAEYGRDSGKPNSGFAGFQEVSNWLGTGTNLLDLFQPSPVTRPLFRTFLALTAKQSTTKRGVLGKFIRIVQLVISLTAALIRYCTVLFLIGAAGGAAIAVLLRWLTLNGSGAAQLYPRGWPLAWAIFGLLCFAWLGGVVTSTGELVSIVFKKLPTNLFGICTGSSDPADLTTTPVLTDWLHNTIQQLAGLDINAAPLTFGMLKAKNITLNMVTTNLSEGQPYKLPFDEKQWIFRTDEFGRLFPKIVVDHLVAHAGTNAKVDVSKLSGCYFTPAADDMPVTVAMRMSLSFPVLICAVPLWDVPGTAYRQRDRNGIAVLENAETDIERHWFSDGGISSNFPIQFFDAWLPHAPTFGINLRSMPPEKAKQHATNLVAAAKTEQSAKGELARPTMYAEMDGQVFLPAADAPQHPEIQPLPGLGDFLGAIWNTAQNYHDNTQSLLPSYRERIVNIRMADTEGGLNLTMDPDVVKRVQQKGAAAGAMLRDHFDLSVHQWVRFQVLMPQLEQQLKKLADVLGEETYKQMLAGQTAPGALPFDRSNEWKAEAAGRVKEVVEMMTRWKALDETFLKTNPDYAEACFFPFESPEPDPVLKVAPKL